jgi:branched-chain amino acid transport system permease protein
VLAGPFLLAPFYVSLMSYVGLASLIALGLVLLTGIGGQTSFGQAAFAGIAAYATAVLSTHAGWSPWLTLPVALFLTGLAAFLIGLVTVRLSGHYIGLATMAWGTSAYYLLGTLPGLGGYNGISEIPGLPGLSRDPRLLLVFIGVLVLGVVWLTHNLLDSRQGRAIRALSGGRLMAESMGVNTARVALWIFVIAAIYAGLSGWLYAHIQGILNPSPFSLTAGIEYLFMVIIGGAGSLFGAIVGATAVTLLRDQLNDLLPRLLGQPGNFEGMVFAAVVILALQRLPRGLVPSFSRLLPDAARRSLPKAEPLPHARRMLSGTVLEVADVTRRFGGLVANDGVGFRVEAGAIMALIGPNGAGKSTMFNLIGGLLRPDSGRISLAGTRIDGLPARRIARAGVARTFQHVRLLPERSVLENIALGTHLRGRAGMLAAMLRLDRTEESGLLAEAARQADRLGLGKHLHTPAGDLSLGLQRIVEIARALCLDPVLLLLDEPAAGLRLQEKRELATLLRGLRDEGVAVLLVEHDMDFVMGLADHVVVMEFGRVIAAGAPESVQADPRVIDAYLGGVEA